MPAYPKPQKQIKERKPFGRAWVPAPKMRDRADAGIPISEVKPLVRGTYAGGVLTAEPKTHAKRCPALLEMARGRMCLIRLPGCCMGRTDTTVAEHSNLAIHGKAKARKADDCYSVWACANCHAWLDQGPATKREKEAAFMAAHSLQVLAWRQIVNDPTEPRRFQDAAQWALTELGAITPNWPAQG